LIQNEGADSFSFESAFFQSSHHFVYPGTNVIIFKKILAKKFRNYLRFLLKLLLVFAKKLIITLVFEENANFSPKISKNRRKL
jgi:hypothetical protein